MKELGLRKLAKNIAATLARQLGSGLLQLVILVVIARVYGPAGNGAYTVALLLPSMLATLLNLGIAPANVYYLSSGKVSLITAWQSTLRFFAYISATGLLLGSLIIAFFRDAWFPGIPPLMLWFALLIFPVTLLLALISSLFQGLQQFRQVNVVLLSQPFLTLIGVLLLVVFGGADIAWLLVAYLVGALVTLILAYRLLKQYFRPEHGAELPNYGREALQYGYKAHVSNILAFVNYKADIFLVNFFIGPAAAGIYIVAVQLSERLWLLSQAVSTVLLPRLSELSSEEDTRKLLTPLITRWVLWITILAALILAAIAYPAIKLIFGEEFTTSVIPLLFILPGIVAGSASRVIANDVAARGRPELNMYTSIGVVTVNVIGNIILIPGYGLPGAAIATSIAYMLNLVMRLIIYSNLTGVPFHQNLILKVDDIKVFR